MIKNLRVPMFILMMHLFAHTTSAQRNLVYGFLRDSVTHYPIAYGTVMNSAINKKIHSNSAGLFAIEATPNDFLYAYAPNYKYDTLLYAYIHTDTITIFLAPAANVLPAVTVTSKYNKYQLDSIRRKEAFRETHGKRLNTVASANTGGFGIGLNLDKVFKRKYKHQKNSERTMLNIERNAYINYRFSAYVVAYYTGLKGEKLQAFINKYSPGYAWLRQHPTNEDVMYYINEKLKEFKNLMQ